MRLEHFKSPLFLPRLPDLCNTLSPHTVECMGWVLMHRAVENQACSCILSGLGTLDGPWVCLVSDVIVRLISALWNPAFECLTPNLMGLISLLSFLPNILHSGQ